MRRKIWSNLPAFAPQPARADRLTIANLRGWRLREPASVRRYTVLRLETTGRLVGFGEGGASTAADMVEARTAAVGRRANESEFIRQRLASHPAVEAAVNAAFLDLRGKVNCPTCKGGVALVLLYRIGIIRLPCPDIH